MTKTSREGAKAEAFAKAKNDVRGSVFFIHILRAPASWSMCVSRGISAVRWNYMGSLPNQQRPLSRVHVCVPGEMFSAGSVKPRDLDRAPQRCKKTSTRHKSSKKSQKMPCKVLTRVLILYMAFLWWEKKYPVLRGTEQKPVDPKINRLCFQRRKRGVSE